MLCYSIYFITQNNILNKRERIMRSVAKSLSRRTGDKTDIVSIVMLTRPLSSKILTFNYGALRCFTNHILKVSISTDFVRYKFSVESICLRHSRAFYMALVTIFVRSLMVFIRPTPFIKLVNAWLKGHYIPIENHKKGGQLPSAGDP